MSPPSGSARLKNRRRRDSGDNSWKKRRSGEQSAGPVTRSVATVPSRSIARESTGSADEVGAATMFIVLLS